MASPVNTLSLTDSSSVVYFFQQSFTLKGNEFKTGVKIADRAFAHGGVDYGDGKIDSRTVKISGTLVGTTDSDYQTNYDALLAAVMKEDQQLRWGSLARYMVIKRCSSVKQEFIEHLESCADVDLEFIAEDPFWRFTTARSVATDLNSPISTFTLTNTGNVDVLPIFTLVASVSNPTFQLINTFDSSATFVYQDAGFTSGTTLTINCVVGAVTRGAADTVRLFTGTFLRLKPGVNTMTYIGEKGQLTSVYREGTF